MELKLVSIIQYKSFSGQFKQIKSTHFDTKSLFVFLSLLQTMAVKKKKSTTALSPQREDPLWAIIDEKIGGRKGLLEAALASTNPKAPLLAELCLDKAFKTAGTKALAKRAGLEADEVVDLYRNRKWLEATMALHDQLPDIISGAAQDAKPSMIPCTECKGKGKVKIPDKEDLESCWVCGGWGEIRKSGDKDKLRFIGDATGITGKVAPAIQNNIQVNSGGMGISFEELVRKASVQVNRPKQIEVEVANDSDSEH